MEKNLTVEGMGNLSAHQATKYEYRAQKLLDKCTGKDTGSVVDLKTGEEVTVVSGSNTGTTANALQAFLDGESEFRGRYSVDVSGSNGTYTIPISSIAKTEEFGGGAGVAGGSDLTRVVEANQCIECARVQYGEENFRSYVSLGKGEDIDTLIEEKEQLDKSWQEAIKSIGQELGESFPKGYWHWQDSFVKNIQSTYNKLPDKLAGKFDRYNPADIWFTDKPYSGAFEHTVHSLEDLTKELNKFYKNKEAVGISLKKTSNPKLVEYTEEKRDVKFNLENIEISERNKGTLYFDILFELDGKKHLCQIRKDSLGYRATVKEEGEREHYDGSVGKGIIQHCLGKIYKGDLRIFEPAFYLNEENRKVAEYILNNLDSFDPSTIEEAEEVLEGVYPIQLSREPETFRRGVFNPQEIAIANSLDAIVIVLQKVGEEKQKEFLGRLIRYAWSIHSESCNFVKVTSSNS